MAKKLEKLVMHGRCTKQSSKQRYSIKRKYYGKKRLQYSHKI